MLTDTRLTDEARELFSRYPGNPILTAAQMPFPCKAVCNPAAIEVDGETLLLLRAIDVRDRSHLVVARSVNGATDWRIDPSPLLSPDTDPAWYDNVGCEDARLTYLEDRGEYVIAYVGVSRYGAGVCLATTQDFRTAKRLCLAIHPYNKDAALLPRRIGGTYRLLHRPTAGPLENIWMSESLDLIHWGNPRCVLEEEDQPGWDSGKVGTGPTPLEMPEGWGLIFHGVQQVEGGWLYRMGLALLDKDEPSRVLSRWPEWVFSPKADYEISGDKPGIVFPSGAVERDGIISLYYGAADQSVALATAHTADLRVFSAEAGKLGL